MKIKKQIPYDFVLEDLSSLHPYTRPMFGCTAIYIGEKIMLILRKKEKMDLDTGIWVCIPDLLVPEMKSKFPMLRGVTFFENENSGWQCLRETEEEFESIALKFCKMIKKGDALIGRIPKPKKLKSKKKTSKKVGSKKK